MDRLTGKHYGRGDYYMECSGGCANDDEMCGGCPWLEKIINRLGAYEDTGLEPDAVQEKICGEIGGGKVHSSFVAFNGVPVDRLFELTDAEKDGRLVVLPCKVGDTVYMPIGRWNTITGFEEDKCDGFHIARDGILQIKAQCYSGNHGTYGIPGETVFLTLEEAEAALKGCDENGRR